MAIKSIVYSVSKTEQHEVKNCFYSLCATPTNVEIKQDATSGKFYIMCNSCKAVGPLMNTPKEAATEWNKVAAQSPWGN